MDDCEKFYAEHAAGGGLVVVTASRKDGALDPKIGIFSALDKAQAWADGLSDRDYFPRVIAPYVVDAPEYGNVPDEDLQ